MRQVSAAAGIGIAFLSDIERGYRMFSAETLVGLARALKIAPADLKKRVDAQRVADLRDKIKKIEESR